jgi:hypothetical protein
MLHLEARAKNPFESSTLLAFLRLANKVIHKGCAKQEA